MHNMPCDDVHGDVTDTVSVCHFPRVTCRRLGVVMLVTYQTPAVFQLLIGSDDVATLRASLPCNGCSGDVVGGGATSAHRAWLAGGRARYGCLRAGVDEPTRGPQL